MYAVWTSRRIRDKYNRRKSCHQETESYLNSDKELFKPSKMWRLFDGCRYYRSKLNNGKKYRSTMLARVKDRGETTRRSKSCSSRWWNEELPEWHFKRKLPANTSTDKSRIETASSKKTNNPWPYSSKRKTVTGKAKSWPKWSRDFHLWRHTSPQHPAIPGPNSDLKKLPPYSPFLNIVEQAISALKAALKVDIRRP